MKGQNPPPDIRTKPEPSAQQQQEELAAALARFETDETCSVTFLENVCRLHDWDELDGLDDWVLSIQERNRIRAATAALHTTSS